MKDGKFRVKRPKRVSIKRLRRWARECKQLKDNNLDKDANTHDNQDEEEDISNHHGDDLPELIQDKDNDNDNDNDNDKLRTKQFWRQNKENTPSVV